MGHDGVVSGKSTSWRIVNRTPELGVSQLGIRAWVCNYPRHDGHNPG